MHDVGLAVWFIDCCQISNNKVIMNTNIWGEQGTEEIVTYFQGLGYTVTIKLNRGGFRVCLDKDSSKHFLKIVMAPLPEFVGRK